MRSCEPKAPKPEMMSSTRPGTRCRMNPSRMEKSRPATPRGVYHATTWRGEA